MKNSPEIFRTTSSWIEYRKALKGSLGFVPTMGALHEGHLSLVRQSLANNEKTLVSIFVNPTQFNEAKDFEQYPFNLDEDLKLLAEEGVDYVLYPSSQDLYPDHFTYRVEETELSKELCGSFRPGHFSGMLTVVLKLLNLAQATKVYFGEKDYQQLKLVEGLVKAFFIPTKVVPCPLVREDDGLAMSSRNRRIPPELRAKASLLYQHLRSSEDPLDRLSALKKDFQVEYVTEKWNRRLAAVRLGDVRLIDNVEIPQES